MPGKMFPLSSRQGNQRSGGLAAERLKVNGGPEVGTTPLQGPSLADFAAYIMMASGFVFTHL